MRDPVPTADRDLSRLRIARDPVRPASRAGAPRLALLAFLMLLGAGATGLAFGWLSWFSPTGGPRQSPATGRALKGAQPSSAPLLAAVKPAGLSASGYLVARRRSEVGTKATGRVVEVLVEPGDRVAAGQVLARLDRKDALARLAEARAVFERARLELARTRALLEQNLATPADTEADEAEAKVAEARVACAESDLADTEVRAPLAGTIVRRSIDPGATFSPLSLGWQGAASHGMFTLVDPESIEAEVEVAEGQVGRVRIGQRAVVDVDALPGKRLRASVARVIPIADRTRGVVKVRLALEEKDPLLLPEMSMRATFVE